MQVTVHFRAQLRRAAGTAAETCGIETGDTLRDLFQRLADRHSTELRSLLFDGDGRLRETLLVFVGNEQATPDRLLRDGDEVVILTPMAGG